MSIFFLILSGFSKQTYIIDEYMGILTKNKKYIYYEPFGMKLATLAKIWDQNLIIKDIKNKKFDLIILYNPPDWDSISERWTKEIINSISLNYHFLNSYADNLVFVPN